MKSCKFVFAGLVLATSVGAAQAATFHFDGNIFDRADVVRIPFALNADADNVRVWTDSYQDGTNFDPIGAVWKKGDTDWTLIAENDDNASIAPGQTSFDSGLSFSSMTAGDYLFTIAARPNFSNGNLLSQGFYYDNNPPVGRGNWDVTGTYWSAHLDGVSSAAASPAPESETYALMLAGLGMMGFIARRNKNAAKI